MATSVRCPNSFAAKSYNALTRCSVIAAACFVFVFVFGFATGARAETSLPVVHMSATMADDTTPMLYAIRAGLFKTAGVDVDLTILPNGAAVSAAVAGGAVDIGKGSLVSVMNAHIHGLPIVLVAAGGMYDARSPYGELVMASDAMFKSGKDLSGKTVAVPAVGDLITLVTSMWVDQNGGDSKTLKFIEMPNSAQGAAVADHRIDAAVLQNPDLAVALAGGKVKRLGLAYSAIAPNYMFSGWFAKSDWASAHIDLVRTCQRVLANAARYTNAHHAETAAILADASKIPLATVSAMPRVDSALTLDVPFIQPMIDASAKYKLLAHGFPASEIIFSLK